MRTKQSVYTKVDWYEWGSEAFEKAKRENKPIFLSVSRVENSEDTWRQSCNMSWHLRHVIGGAPSAVQPAATAGVSGAYAKAEGLRRIPDPPFVVCSCVASTAQLNCIHSKKSRVEHTVIRIHP